MTRKILVSIIFCAVYINCIAQIKSEGTNMVLPALLKDNNGKNITTKKTWIKTRRPQVLTLFEDNLYGQMPKDFDSIRFKSQKLDENAIGGNAILKQIGIVVYRNNQSVTINLSLFVPKAAKKPAPVFLLINHRPKSNTDVTRGTKSDFWPVEKVIERGYALAAFHVSDVAADNKDTYHLGVLKLYPEQLKMPNGMKAIGAWAWGAMRAMDYFETDKDIDASKVAVVGHSRGGKAALWTGAQDMRFAYSISNNSGEGGAALSNHPKGETILDLNTNFPHWFCDNYKKYSKNISALPVDQHMLLALMAPRAVYVASASEDNWADQVGEFLSIKYAEPAFKLFGIAPLPAQKQPPLDTPVKTKQLGYHFRTGVHNLTLYDWERYMDFTDQSISK